MRALGPESRARRAKVIARKETKTIMQTQPKRRRVPAARLVSTPAQKRAVVAQNLNHRAPRPLSSALELTLKARGFTR